MEKYFNIRYEFDSHEIHRIISSKLDNNQKGYICVSDGVILSLVNNDSEYRKIIDNSIFSICDSGWVPLYLKWIYGYKRNQYCGSQIFGDIIGMKRYKMIFLGTSNDVLRPLKKNLTKIDPKIDEMPFVELPFCQVDEFDYKSIANDINKYKPDIIWIALGAPKQERFMAHLQSYLDRGVMIAVGAAFNFYANTAIKRAPKWMIKSKIEFVYRLWCEPKKQYGRCVLIVKTMPKLLFKEWRKKYLMNINQK